jgi:hypothetical protein
MGEPQRYLQYIFFPYRVVIFAVELFFLFLLLLKREREDAIILIFIVTHIILLSVLDVSKNVRYLTVLMPFVSVILSKVFIGNYRWFIERKVACKRKSSKNVFYLAACCFLMFAYVTNQFAGDVYALVKHKEANYWRFISEVKHYIPKDSKVWGSITFWWGFSEFPYRTQFTYGKDVDEFKPEYVILFDADTWGNVSWTTGSKMTAHRERYLTNLFAGVRRKMEEFCSKNGELVGKVDDKFYGDVEIYHIRY